MEIHNDAQIRVDKTYTLFELADRAGMRVAELQNLIEKGHLDSHITDDTEVVNGKDFLQWQQKNHYNHQRHYQ